MGLYERIKELAKSKGYSINRLEKELGFARSSINKFNTNKPSIKKIQQIADFLEISVDAITGTDTYSEEESNKEELNAKDERDIAKDLENIMRKLESGENGPASFDGEELSEEAMELFREELQIALKRLKIINKEKYTPNKYKK